ncbi:hypothetical protein AB0I16_31670 [Streptomyces sp. NPDC050703]|uniref:hypothetical protein n=1 Tax=Streptomyces sp. NPDC050703 TaxID=3157218 RepID=UPI003445BF1B
MKTFRRRINTLLTEFEGSAGGSAKVGAQKVSRASFSGAGSAFPEADGLYAEYDQVHEQLTSLSKMLGDQIDAMGIAVHGADVGFDNLEEDLRQRFWAIQTRVGRQEVPSERERGGEPDAQGGQGGQGDQGGQGGQGDEKSDAGWS